jgi:hypothetical protein
MPGVRAPEVSLNSQLVVQKYGFGAFYFVFGVLIFTKLHPVFTGLIALGLFALGSFHLSIARVNPVGHEVKYRRFVRWHSIAYSDVRECGEAWVFGYIKPRRYVLPWGRIYFARPQSSESLFGWDQKIIDEIRAKSDLSKINRRN